ncbi:MAG: 50S ribosomal protein L28 [Verrucomicrobia bacterium]|nr:50S ribosomal protein L28 [Verrucomicrobiota bacterium]
MGKRCQFSEKTPRRGRSYALRGISKKKKGIGLNITGKTKRRFEPNLQRKRFWISSEERWVTLCLSASAMRTVDKIGVDAAVRTMRMQGEKI